jgi:hypothetical protein
MRQSRRRKMGVSGKGIDTQWFTETFLYQRYDA